MKDLNNNLVQILISNTWEENLNTWNFNEEVLTIKKVTGEGSTTMIKYSLEEGLAGRFILVTDSPELGMLTLIVNYKNPFPKLILQSADKKNIYIELLALNGSKSQIDNV